MVAQIMKVFICIVAVKTVCAHNVLNSNDMEQYKLSYYDPRTGIPLVGELEKENYEDDDARIPSDFAKFVFRGLSCECENFTCGCCAGINITTIKLKQNACTTFSFDREDLSIKMNVVLNDREIYKNQVSAKNPPPMCMPLPYFPLVNFCVRFFDVSLPGSNLHACIDFETRIASSPVLVLHFNCVQLGTDGFQWGKPGSADAHQCKPEAQELNIYDEVEFEQADLQPLADVGSQTLSPEEQQIGQLKV